MKKTLFALIATLAIISAYAQDYPEPEFNRQAFAITANNTTISLPRERGTIKTKASASMYIVGVGNIKSKVSLVGSSSSVVLPWAFEQTFIIRMRDNDEDPRGLIKIVKFDKTKKERKLEVYKVSTFGGVESDKSGESIEFQAKRYGKSSYMLTVPGLDAGEYGIVVNEANADYSVNKVDSYSFLTFSIYAEEPAIPTRRRK